MELADQYESTVLALKDLARELRIRSPAKLLQAAMGRVPGANSRLAALALEDSVSKQVLAPAYRSMGKSAAEAPGAILETDLLDFSQNTRNTKEKYALILADVYTRRARAVPLLNKKPETVNAAMQESLPTLVGDKKDFAITSDRGKEFSKLEEGGIPAEAVHREKGKKRYFHRRSHDANYQDRPGCCRGGWRRQKLCFCTSLSCRRL